MYGVRPTFHRRYLSVLFFLCCVILLFFYQNCSGVNISPIASVEKACSSYAYNIVRDVNATSGPAVYFLQQNKHGISTEEYSGEIEWFVNGVPQVENIIDENRLRLDCSSHGDGIQIKARFVDACGETVEKIEGPFSYPEDICGPLPEEPESPGPEMSYCEEYKAKYPGVENEPGFQDHGLVQAGPNLERMTDFFAHEPAAWWKTMEINWITQAEEQLFLSGRGIQHVYHANLIGRPQMYGKYVALKLTIPASAPDMLLSFNHLNDAQSFGHAAADMTVSISPCPGDFRFQDRNTPALGQAENEFIGIRAPNGLGGIGTTTSIGITNTINGTFSGYPAQIWIPKGKTFYINATYNLNNRFGVNQYTCPDNPIPDHFSDIQRQRLEQFGCGGLTRISRQCYANGQIIDCPN